MNVKDLSSDERAKIAAVLSKDRKDDIGWMYKQKNNEDSEDFLLGKRVPDVGQLQQMTQDYEESPTQRLARIDMQLKYREDPLTLMKQREAEKRMELLQNTAKVKKLKRLLTLQKHQKTKKCKEKYKRRRKHRSRSRSSSSSSSSGDELLEKFIKIVRRSDQTEEVCATAFKAIAPSSTDSGTQNIDSGHSSTTRRPSNYCSNRSESRPKPELREHLPKEVLEAKRAQMTRDAEDHAKQRLDRYIKHSHKKVEEETRQASEAKRHGASFLGHLKNDHVQRSSIEEGVHRKASSRQRGGEMNSNFLRK